MSCIRVSQDNQNDKTILFWFRSLRLTIFGSKKTKKDMTAGFGWLAVDSVKFPGKLIIIAHGICRYPRFNLLRFDCECKVQTIQKINVAKLQSTIA
jgi:hypothetical protein